MAWNQYHDQLVQEAIALMTEPQWYSQPTITNRLDAIRTELNTAGQALATQQQQQADDLMAQFQSAHDTGNAAQEARYQQLLTGYGDRTNALDTRFNTLVGGYQNRASQYGGAYDQIAADYGARQTSLESLLDGMGASARTDIQQRYAGARSGTEQDLMNRGLGNSSIRSSVLSGLTSREQQELARHDEQMRQQQFGYRSALSADTLGARGVAAQMGAGLQGDVLGAQGQQIGMYADASREPFGVMERRTDAMPSLADIANLSMQFGRGTANQFALPSFGSTTSYQPRYGSGGAMF